LPAGSSFVAAAEAAVSRSKDAVVNMKYWPAQDLVPAEKCRREVREADVYVGIVGFRYGSPVPEKPDVSYTELEFNQATEAGLTRLVFLLGKDPEGSHDLYVDPLHGDLQLAFRKRLAESKLIRAMVTTPDELEMELFHALSELPRAVSVLPGCTARFVGRVEAVRKLLDLIGAHDQSGQIVAIHAIDGMAGVGKTELALHVGHAILGRFPGGAVFLDLAGYSPGLEPVSQIQALQLLLKQRGVATDEKQCDEATLQVLWQNECARQRLLIVLDNVRDKDQVEPLLPRAAGCLVLITSRRKLIGLPGVTPFELPLLDFDGARELFVSLAGAPTSTDDAAVERVVRLCGWLPLAIRIAASMLAHRPGYTVAALADDLDTERQYLDDLDDDDGSLHIAVHASIRVSYEHLSENLKMAFRLCGYHPGPEVTESALAAMLSKHCGEEGKECVIRVTDRDVALSRRLLHGLVDRNLIRMQLADGRRYRMHDLVRASARLSRPEASEDERCHVLSHLRYAYLATLVHAESWRYSGTPIQRVRPNNTPLSVFVDLNDARRWVILERENLLALVDTIDERSALISQLLGPQLRDQGYWVEARHCYEDAEKGYGHLRIDVLRAQAIRGLAHIAAGAGDFAAARRDYQRARSISRRVKDDVGQALALRGLGMVSRLTDDYDDAGRFLRRAIKIFAAYERTLGDNLAFIREYAVVRTELGLVEQTRGRLHIALGLLSEAWHAYITIGDIDEQHKLLRIFAEIEWVRGNADISRRYLDELLRHLDSSSDPDGKADALWELGQLEKETGDPVTAIALFEQVIELRPEIRTPFGYARGLLGLADAERLDGQCETARAHFEETLRLCRNHDDRDGVAQAHLGLGDVAIAVGDQVLAAQCWHRALAVAEEIGLHFIIHKVRSRIAGVEG
jgi:tetratricopeptide (TPR) repeat protein